MSGVIWHDLECGGYRADLPLWRELAEHEGSPVLDVGAGTGRVALDLARRGHEVVLDRTTAEDLEAAAPRHGLRVLPRRRIAETEDYVGSEVVMLGG